MPNSVIVTGGSKGIGWAIVETLARSGYFVVSGSRTLKKNIPTDLTSKILQVKIDVKNEYDHEKLVELANEKDHQLVAYVNNAGFSEWRPIENVDEEFISEIIRTNLVGYFWGSKAASASLKNGGSIVNISSLAAKRGTSNNSAYVATKFGVAGLTQSLCKELGHRGIRVNAVCPVLVETEGLLNALNEEHSPANGNSIEFLKSFSQSQAPLLRLPTAQEVANLVRFLISDDASGISGQSINVDCGVLPN
jgi:3-oxoacyl-[acyl-carrier protein] reductase/meso-butanediol dehydrogenase/(S,S)-butanediol dehydrogenase/diacetyl reductase